MRQSLRLDDSKSAPFWRTIGSQFSMFAFAICILSVLGQASLGQESDPFGSGQTSADPFSVDVDPFGVQRGSNAQSNPFAEDSKSAAKAKEIARIAKAEAATKGAGKIAVLEYHLNETVEALNAAKATIRHQENKVAELAQTNHLLKKKINQLESEGLQVDAREKHADESYMNLIEELLGAKDVASQLTGLNHILNVHNKAIEKELAFVPANSNVLLKVQALAESDNQQVRIAAIKDLLVIRPDSARDLGFQAKGYWQSITERTVTGERISQAFSVPTDFVYDEVPLADLVDQIRMEFRFDFAIDDSVDPETLLTIDIQGQPLASGLNEIATKLGLVVCQLENMVKLLPPTHPDIRSSLSYNVRGLISEKMTLDQLEKHVGQQLGDESKVWKMGHQILSVKATTMEQRKVSTALGALSPIAR